jgi:2-polyprenyl-3-methyl-5-hydroxy-6-metoxy-1,4-benzoquinol methylase
MTGYALDLDSAEKLEQARLLLLAQRYDPFTIRQFDAIGVGEGWRCLDVGAGQGSVTRLLAARVGATGSVLATDLDTRLLEPLADDRVEVRPHDLLTDPLPESAFDLVHARNVLLHLPSPLDALRRLVAAVRPGGWIAIGDVDFTTLELSPSTPAWQRTRSAYWDAASAAGLNLRYGARVVTDLQAVGLADVEGEYVIRDNRGGSPSASLFAHTLERLRERMLSLGATVDDLEETHRLLADSDVSFRGPSTSFGWGRRAH